jgi:hypothetical protein
VRDPICQGVALHQFKDERVRLAAVIEPINRTNVGMVERREHLRFPLETGEAIGIGRAFSLVFP